MRLENVINRKPKLIAINSSDLFLISIHLQPTNEPCGRPIMVLLIPNWVSQVQKLPEKHFVLLVYQRCTIKEEAV